MANIFFGGGSNSFETYVWVLYLICIHLSNGTDVDTLEVQYTVDRGPDGKLQFQQTTLFKGHVIFTCSSPTLRDQPQQDWVTHAFTQEELEERHQQCKIQCYEHLAWFERIKQAITVSAADILQRRRGCMISSSGEFAFDEWGVNGDGFLTFDPRTPKWTAQTDEANPLATELNGEYIRSHIYSHFCQILCNKSHIFKMKLAAKPSDIAHTDMDIHVFLKTMTPTETFGFLTCHVIDFDLSGVRIQLTKDGVPLVRGVQLFAPRPNEDGTVQMRVQVQISLKDTTGYRCKVQRKSINITVLWDGLPDEINFFQVVSFVLASLLGFGLLMNLIIHRKYLADRLCRAGGSSTEPQNNYLRYVETQEEFDKWAREDDEYYGNHTPA